MKRKKNDIMGERKVKMMTPRNKGYKKKKKKRRKGHKKKKEWH